MAPQQPQAAMRSPWCSVYFHTGIFFETTISFTTPAQEPIWLLPYRRTPQISQESVI